MVVTERNRGLMWGGEGWRIRIDPFRMHFLCSVSVVLFHACFMVGFCVVHKNEYCMFEFCHLRCFVAFRVWFTFRCGRRQTVRRAASSIGCQLSLYVHDDVYVCCGRRAVYVQVAAAQHNICPQALFCTVYSVHHSSDTYSLDIMYAFF